MIPHDPKREQINPRILVQKEGPEALWRLLVGVGYVPQEEVFCDFLQALLSNLPWANTGIRGGGKSTFANKLGIACNLDRWGVTGRRGIRDSELFYSWDKDEQREWMRDARAEGKDLDQARREKWTRPFLKLGEVLGAFDAAAMNDIPPLLFMDELDKLSLEQQNSLLQVYCDGVMFVPDLVPDGFVGCYDQSKWPIVISSANAKIASAPLRSRHLFTPIETPDIKKEVEILLAHVPDTEPFLLKVAVKILDAIRAIPGLDDPPALRESIHLLKAFNRDRLTHPLPAGFMKYYVCYLVKHKEDRVYLIEQLDYVDACARCEHKELDEWVDLVIGEKRLVEIGA